jgi:ADP-dependent NAD(P)H-hydrate dehydratase / NAD(P)H-hydrate epimerase
MELSYWHKQTTDKPLFPELLWSRPENRSLAGKLLVVGGNAHGFATTAAAYSAAGEAGIGTVRVLLPSVLQKSVAKIFAGSEFAGSTPSGSFAQVALADFIEFSNWADGIVMAGDFGKNSETSLLLEKYLSRYTGQVTLAGDSLDFFLSNPTKLMHRSNTTLVLSFAQLQRLISGLKSTEAITSDISIIKLIEILRSYSSVGFPVNLATVYANNLIISNGGQVSSTTVDVTRNFSNAVIASYLAVWWLQTPQKAFEGMSTASFLLNGGKV